MHFCAKEHHKSQSHARTGVLLQAENSAVLRLFPLLLTMSARTHVGCVLLIYI